MSVLKKIWIEALCLYLYTFVLLFVCKQRMTRKEIKPFPIQKISIIRENAREDLPPLHRLTAIGIKGRCSYSFFVGRSVYR